MSATLLHDKLREIQTDLKAPKDQRNAFGKYNYRSCEDILEALKPLLSKHGLVLTITDQIVFFPSSHLQAFTQREFSKDGKQVIESTYPVGGDRFYVKATATLTDGIGNVSASGWAREEQDKKGMDGAQITGAASSYARKYALNGLFCIDDTKDADATNQPEEASKQTAPKPQQSLGAAPASIAPATQEQMKLIDDLCTQTNTSLTKLKEAYQLKTEIPSIEAANAMIDGLKLKLTKMKVEQTAPVDPSTPAA